MLCNVDYLVAVECISHIISKFGEGKNVNPRVIKQAVAKL